MKPASGLLMSLKLSEMLTLTEQFAKEFVSGLDRHGLVLTSDPWKPQCLPGPGIMPSSQPRLCMSDRSLNMMTLLAKKQKKEMEGGQRRFRGWKGLEAHSTHSATTGNLISYTNQGFRETASTQTRYNFFPLYSHFLSQNELLLCSRSYTRRLNSKNYLP